jgi:hypothetical protein
MVSRGSISSVRSTELLELRNNTAESERDVFLPVPTESASSWDVDDEHIQKTGKTKALLCLVLQHFSKSVNAASSSITQLTHSALRVLGETVPMNFPHICIVRRLSNRLRCSMRLIQCDRK